MKLVCAALLLVLVAQTAEAAQALQRVEIFQYGLYQVDRRTPPVSPPEEIEQRLDTSDFTHIRTTRMIPARIGTEFCFRFRTIGDLAVRTPLRIVTTFPGSGLIGRVSRRPIESEERETTILAGFPGIWCWGFDTPNDIALGQWQIALFADRRKLAEQTFTVVAPGTF